MGDGREDRALGVYCLDVGQGDATVVLPPRGEAGAVIFDCRDDRTVLKLLDHWGVDRVAAVIVSHLDLDHIGGVASLLAALRDRVERVFLSTDRDIRGGAPDANRARALVDHAVTGQREGIWELMPATRDTRPVLEGDDWSVAIVAPEHATTLEREQRGTWEDANAASAVLRVTMGEVVVLVGGDAPLRTWAGLRQEELKAQLVRVPHHGGALDDGGVPEGWNAATLYERVAAAHAVISVGTGNRYDHPDPDWIQPLASGRCQLLCTEVTQRCQPGVSQDARAWREEVLTAEHFAEPPWYHLTDRRRSVRWGQAEVPCAGTVVVRVCSTGSIEVYPERAFHDGVVRKWQGPLCRAG